MPPLGFALYKPFLTVRESDLSAASATFIDVTPTGPFPGGFDVLGLFIT